MLSFHDITFDRKGHLRHQMVFGTLKQAENYAIKNAGRLNDDDDLYQIETQLTQTINLKRNIIVLDHAVNIFECCFKQHGGLESYVLLGSSEQAERYAQNGEKKKNARANLQKLPDIKINTPLDIINLNGAMLHQAD